MAQQVAVLVDGENIGARHAARILSIAARHGDPSVVRVYADAQRASDWHGACGYRMVHSGTGKNAADLFLALDAMELALSRHLRCFVIASSDGDFNHVATRLREHGAKVIGIGEAKAPNCFRASCTEFVELDAKPQHSPFHVAFPPVTQLDQTIRAVIAAQSQNGSGIRIAELSARLHALHGVRISTYPEKNWRTYLLARPTLYDLDPRGPEAMVRFRPAGFGVAA
ncbi:NYN domain-containing protein [Pararhodobacter sp. SW119]|uniref:NYN domain-containing protein n=1 Tax=Pararhodobacter sp. SW119 TaxID=2780075 RepID=UPI001AE0C364|nr:NYN domain-containing protein [Pararhodobacter sp. SW119]